MRFASLDMNVCIRKMNIKILKLLEYKNCIHFGYSSSVRLQQAPLSDTV
jgi:hypothetical protein